MMMIILMNDYDDGKENGDNDDQNNYNEDEDDNYDDNSDNIYIVKDPAWLNISL